MLFWLAYLSLTVGMPHLYLTPSTINVERVARIELANNPWQGFRLPLHHTRIGAVAWIRTKWLDWTPNLILYPDRIFCII